MNEDLARRSIDSVKWNFISNILYNAVYLAQTIILARLLPVEAFGIYAGAGAIVVMANGFSTFGIASAFIHRCKETEDIEQAAAVHFTLQTILSAVWIILILLIGFLFLDRSEPGLFTAFSVLAVTTVVKNFASTPRLILNRQIRFQRYSVISVIDAVITFISAVLLAVLKQPIWALLATNISNAILQIVLLFFWRPVWKPRFLWKTDVVKYFLSFGSKHLAGGLLLDVLDRGDDYWTKNYLGVDPLGYYSRAYALAKVPANIISTPIFSVAMSTYAELKEDRKGLSQAFFETNALLIRMGFLFVGILALIAPEFIRILLGEKWMPMVFTFQLMLPFTMFDPLKQLMASVFIAVGKPGTTVQIRTIQVFVLIGFLFLLGPTFGIEGVAVAVDVMMVVGIILILFWARKYVDLYLGPMFLAPGIALFAGLAAGYVVDHFFFMNMNAWVLMIGKSFIIGCVYCLTLWLFERERIFYMVKLLKKYIFKKGNPKTISA